MELISIVIPVYNTGKYLRNCIESCLNQSYTNIEVVLVNDGSTDCSLEIINEYMHYDSVRLIDKDNEGLLTTRLRGVEASKGSYVFFVDSDDYIPIDAVSSLYSRALSSNSDVVIGGYTTFSGSNYKVVNNYAPIGLDDDLLFASLVLGKIGGNIAGSLIKRDLLIKLDYNEDIIIGEDMTLQMQLRCITNKIVYTSKSYYYYRLNPSSITRCQSPKILQSHISFMKWQTNYIYNCSLFSESSSVKIALKNSLLNGAFVYLSNNGALDIKYINITVRESLKLCYKHVYISKIIYCILYVYNYNNVTGLFLIRRYLSLKQITKRILCLK